ncbi:cytochrome P450 [Aspergillus thermomutatus]|uniref:Cytochrome P450 n=1 Tax=Aspergillus thermomutatus TaxID=41047 RepID=A0A397GSV6_ASPTH|nr:uncharacterized protein CDV56_100664 [Aspergillus thermomutatus]RHZ53905.1 hypothetical protein CDV56_100664 [Aspergillus thermomutatus]
MDSLAFTVMPSFGVLSIWGTLAVSVVLCLVAKSIYNVYFHPLSRFPGPRLWSLTRLCWTVSLARGDLHLKIKSFHDRYGSIVRVAPDELSFIDGSAWQDIYAGSQRNKGLPKNDVIFGAQQFRSILDGTDEEHTRMRKVLASSFSNKNTDKQEGLLQRYLDILIRNLHQVARNSKAINVVEWYTWFAFDTTGELAFSESFNQLEQTISHPWVQMITSHLKYSALSVCLRFYSPLDRLMPLIAPPSLHRLKWSFISMAREKVFRRMNRPDSKGLDDIFGACNTPSDEKPIQMTTEELVGTFTFLIVSGSETTATVLTGITNYLCHNPRVLKLLTDELRSVPEEGGLTLASTATMPYLNGVIKEGMRLCHPVPGALSRVVPPEGKVIGGHFVPGNTLVGISPFAAYISDSNFASPYEFTPERWLGDQEDNNRNIFQPFSVGGRNCIGQNLAWAEMRLILARVLYNFDIEQAGGRDWMEKKSYLLWEKDPLLIRVKAAREGGFYLLG